MGGLIAWAVIVATIAIGSWLESYPKKQHMRKSYTITIQWSEDHKCYRAIVPELSGCTADGVTYEHALYQAQIAISNWLERASLHGQPIPEPVYYKL